MKAIEDLMSEHNQIVKDDYLSNESQGFYNWIYQSGDFIDRYIEIPSNETQSGNAEILDLEDYIHLFRFGV